MKKIEFIQGIENIIDKYEVFILDQWGVMHDGKKGYDNAINCINYLKLKKKRLIIISNSSKRKKESKQRLPLLGFNPNDFDEVLTSGEMIWNSIAKSLDRYGDNLKKCFYMFDNKEEDGSNYINGLKDIKFVKDISKADFILACTPYQNFQPIDYIPLLEKAYKNNVLMFCANPDFETVEKNAKNIYCMGTIAQLYEDMGGKIIILGKPNKDIYVEATKSLIDFQKNKIVAIGDSIFHDIKGANNFGIDSVLITSGIHSKYFSKRNPIWEDDKNKLIKYDILPTFISYEFSV